MAKAKWDADQINALIQLAGPMIMQIVLAIIEMFKKSNSPADKKKLQTIKKALE